MAIKIQATGVSKYFPSGTRTVKALQDFSLNVEEGEFLCIVGPSGCGKSTFLRILAGLTRPSSGEVRVIQGQHAKKPLTNVVFQEYGIFPWRTVVENVAFGLKMRGIDTKTRNAIAVDWLSKVGLLEFIQAYPYQLSGGMKQRVSIARAFANDPEVLLMDEPLGALDAQTRAVLQEELLRLWEDDRKTVVYVTHSIEEALLMGDRVVLMTARPGRSKAEYKVSFSRPRQYRLTATPEFSELSYAIWESLQVEVKTTLREQKGAPIQ